MVSMAVWASLPACSLLCRSSCTAKEKQKSRIMCKDQNAGTRQGTNLFADPSMQHQMEAWRQAAAAYCLTGHTQCRNKTLAEHWPSLQQLQALHVLL